MSALAAALDAQAVDAWLASLDPVTPVGQPRSLEGCALACYLQARGFDDAWVGIFDAYHDREQANLPRWAGRFIDLHDAVDGVVTAGIARELLREALQ